MHKTLRNHAVSYATRIRANLSALSILAALAMPLTTSAALYTVDTVENEPDADPNDGQCRTASGKCSLLAAIQQANATPGLNRIEFNIPARGIQTINVDAQLPIITNRVEIDGTTQAGYAGTPLIQLRGNSVNGTTNHGLWIHSTGCSVRGLQIHGFSGSGILLESGGSHSIQANWIGTDGSVDFGFSNLLDGVTVVDSANNLIGGPTTTARNVISGNRRHGIAVLNSASTGNIIQGNFIGTDKDGRGFVGNFLDGVLISAVNGRTDYAGRNTISKNTISANGHFGIEAFHSSANIVQGNFVGVDASGDAALGNGLDGVAVDGGANNMIGGTTSVQRNIISANGWAGVEIFGGSDFSQSATGNVVQGNFIGTDGSGNRSLGNSFEGVLIVSLDTGGSASGTVVGAAQLVNDPAAGNLIAYNGAAGVAVAGGRSVGNIIRVNSIHDNGTLGIDLTANDNPGNHVTPNDKDDLDEGPNHLINFPVGVTAYYVPPGRKLLLTNKKRDEDVTVDDVTMVSGVVDSLNPANLTIDVYANRSPHPITMNGKQFHFGEGERYLGTTNCSPAGTFRLILAGPLLGSAVGQFISATVTGPDGSTSEFSPVCGNRLGTGNPDSDGDGLCDCWEMDGIDYNGDGIIDLDLPQLGANPKHKDIFLEIDFMDCAEGGCPPDDLHSDVPSPKGINLLQKAFAEAPVDNPDNNSGVALHIAVDERLRHEEKAGFPSALSPSFCSPAADFNKLKSDHFGTEAERSDYKKIRAKMLVYRYCIFGHSINDSTKCGECVNNKSSGVSPGLPSADFLITLGNWHKDEFIAGGGRPLSEAGTLMHELGHTLGLYHGGGDAVNYKPNYLSVMNYSFQTLDRVRDRPLDYSREVLKTLHKNDLDEGAGIGGPLDRKTVYYLGANEPSGKPIITNVVAPAGFWIDWNGDGVINSLKDTVNINCVDINCLHPDEITGGVPGL